MTNYVKEQFTLFFLYFPMLNHSPPAASPRLLLCLKKSRTYILKTRGRHYKARTRQRSGSSSALGA